MLLFGIGTRALVWGFLCQVARQGGEAFLRRFLGSISKPVSSSRPALRSRRRAQELSRLAVAPTLQHGPDHTLTASSTTAPWCGRDDDQRGARFRARFSRAATLYSVGPKDPNHDAVMRIGSEAPKRRTHSSIRLEAKGRLGIPPARTVIGVPSQADKAETVGVLSASSVHCAARKTTPSGTMPSPHEPPQGDQ